MIPLTLACTSSDRARPLMDGRFRVPGCDITFLPGEPEDIFRHALRDLDPVMLIGGAPYVLACKPGKPFQSIGRFVQREVATWGAVVRGNGIRAD